jgi:hypothetical protein
LSTYQDWQWDAKRYARTIGVVRFAANLVASTAGRVNLIVEQRNDDGDWVETEDRDLRAVLAGYGNETFGQTANELVRLHTWHYQVAGEACIVHRDDTGGVPEWMISSMDSVEWDKPGRDLATIRFHPSGVVSDGTAVVLPRDQVLRYWMPDEEWLGLATSPMTSVMDDIRRYKSLVRYAQRQAESYLAMNGILWTPEKAHASAASGDATEHEGDDPTSPAEQDDRIFDLYNEWAGMGINDDDSIAAVLPPMFWYGEKGDEPIHIDLHGGLDEHGPEHRAEALSDFARGSDSPMSMIATGGGSDENHWGAWITQERFIAAVAPTLDRVTHQDMTVAFLYPIMRLAGRTDLRRTRIGYDATPVIVHPDQSDKALRGFLSGLVGTDPARAAMGFTESDKPTDEDLALLKDVLSNFGGGQAPGAPPPGQVPGIKAPGEKVGPATVQETGPAQPQPTGTGSPFAFAAAATLEEYLPGRFLDGYMPVDRTVHVGEIHVHHGNGNGHTRTAASLNAGMNGVMVALPVTDDIRSLATPDGEPADAMHMTLLYFGKPDEIDPAMQGTLKGICSALASNYDMPLVDLSHIERFAPTPGGHSGDLFPAALVDDGPDVPALVERLKAACDAAGVPYHDDHAFRSHVTLGYYPQDEGPESGPLPTPQAYAPDALMLHWGDEVDQYPFVDAPEPGALPPDGPIIASARRAYAEGQARDAFGRFDEMVDLVDPVTGAIDAERATMSAFPEKTQAKILNAVTTRISDPPEAIHDRYAALLDAAKGTPVWEQGMRWYDDAHADASGLANAHEVPLENIAGGLAAMSPGTFWAIEVPIADAMLEMDKGTVNVLDVDVLNAKLERLGASPVENGMPYASLDPRTAAITMQTEYQSSDPRAATAPWGVGYSWDNFSKALDIFRNDEVDERLNGVKVRSFYNNISDPADPDSITIDVKMVQAAADPARNEAARDEAAPAMQERVKGIANDSTTMGVPMASRTVHNEDGTKTVLKTTIGPVPYLSDVLRDLATEYSITPQQAQAIVWTQWGSRAPVGPS